MTDILSLAIAQHYENVEYAINYLTDLYFDDVDIGEANIFRSVMARYDLLDDGFDSEHEYIIKEVQKRIARK